MEDNKYEINGNDEIMDTSNNEIKFDSSNEAINNEIKVESTDFVMSDNVYSEPANAYSESASEPVYNTEANTSANVNSNGYYYNYSQNANSNAAPRAQVHYTESYKKPKEKKTNLFQLILVSVVSAVLGAGVFFAAVQFVAPVINGSSSSKLAVKGEASIKGADKIVQITSSDSPVSAIAEKVGPSIVGIKVTAGGSQDFFFDVSGGGVGEGSGIIISEDGYILTNYHVIESALEENTNTISTGSKIEVILPSMKEKSYTATVVGKDSKGDIAVLKIAATGLPKAELGDSATLKIGELAVAIGNPGGMEYIGLGSVTAGIISGLNRTIQLESGATLNLIQTDAAINPGNSGGALCNSKGQVIGINTVKISASGFEGLGFAIPINNAKEIAQNLIDYKYVKGRPYLGVSIDQTFTADVAKHNNVPEGVLVYNVSPLSAAYKAGIERGDIITKFDGVKVTQYSELENQKNKHKPGDTVSVEIYRYTDKSTKTLKVILDEDKN